MSPQLERQRTYRKSRRGRVCRSCRRRDLETAFTERLDLCCACYNRSERNGFCPACGFARYRTGRQGSRSDRPCRCPTRDETRLWDALRWREPGPITYLELARAFGKCVRTVERHAGRIVALARRFDPEARFERDLGRNGAPVVLVADVSAVARGLERLVLGEGRP